MKNDSQFPEVNAILAEKIHTILYIWSIFQKNKSYEDIKMSRHAS